MLESGSFKYKCNLYDYCERYMIAFEEECVGEMVLHAPPLNLLSTLLVPFSLLLPRGYLLAKISQSFSYFIFWAENLLFLAAFLAFELLLSPFIYIVIMINIMYSTRGMFTTMYNVLYWILFGVFYMLIILMKEVYNLFLILAIYEGCRRKLGDDPIITEEEINKKN
jgi:hypothetical protein